MFEKGNNIEFNLDMMRRLYCMSVSFIYSSMLRSFIYFLFYPFSNTRRAIGRTWLFDYITFSILLTLLVSCVQIFSSAFVSEITYCLHGADIFLRSQQVLS